MKRPRSYGEDLDEDAGEKGTFKDWDRPSSHRRFYPKLEVLRKGSSSSSYDRSLDDDRDTPRPLRKRFEHDSDGFDRGRYRDGGGDRTPPVSSSPRGGSYGGDRLHRSESFSAAFRRDFPKGFRSERDRSRREVSSGSSWRRSSGADEMRSPSVTSESAGRGNHGASEERGNHGASEERGKVRSRDSSSGEQSRRTETVKTEKGRKESCSSSEMEEGELEPDLEPEPETEPSSHSKPMMGTEPESCKDRVTECNAVSEASSENKEIVSIAKKPGFDDEVACNGEEAGKSLIVSRVDRNDEVSGSQNDSVKELNDEVKENVEGNLGGNEQETVKGDIFGMPSHRAEQERPSDQVVEEVKEAAFSSSPPASKSEKAQGEGRCVEIEAEAKKKEETNVHLQAEQKMGRGIDLEAEPECGSGFLSLAKEIGVESSHNEVDMVNKPKENYKDKGKSLAISFSGKADSAEDDNATEGTSGRGFELVFQSDVTPPVEANCGGGIVIGKHKDEKPKLEPLDLSLSLPGIVSDHLSKHPNPNQNSPSRAKSIQSVPSSFRTLSDGFTTSISFSGSQTFVHNPSCSLTQNSMENYEHSVGSHPIFQGVDQASNGTIWQSQTSNEPKRKGGGGTLFQRVLLNGNPSHGSLHALNGQLLNVNPSHGSPHALNGQHHSKPDGLSRQSSLPRQISPAHSHGSHDTRSENSKDRRLLTRERSSSSLFRSEQREGEQLVLGVGVIERILFKIVTEPLQVMSRMLREMTEHSVAYLKETISEMIANADKRGQVHALQEALQRRSDLTMETVSKCSRTLLEILVSLKTGVTEYLRRKDNVQSSDLVAIFLNLKCHNPACGSMLPVDDCDCRVCVQKSGFCRECMCLVCSKFDMASNTCSWVGCDVCLHWCHTDCGLRESHIRNGQSASGTQGMTEMQFHCVACDHPSEMFGFVKEVFKTFAKEWKAETLSKELQYVRRIFSASNDARGKKLCDLADNMLMKLDDKSNLSEVINYIMAFLSESESNNIINNPSTFPPKEPPRNNAEGSNMIACSSKEVAWLPSVSADKVSCMENMGILSSADCVRIGKQTRDAELQVNLEKKPVVDELESIVRLKQAEAKMYQERADDARREADGLKRIAVAKNVKIEEDYATRIAKLRLGEAEERRRQKLDELQAIERAHREYFNLKMRMEADIKDLLLKMEATKRNFST